MSDQNERVRAEMEVKPRLQNAILAHHIIQVVSAVVISIFQIYKLAMTSFHLESMILILFNIPTVVFVILWIGSKCSYQDMRLILVHFDSCLSTLWFLIFFAWCITSIPLIDGIVTMVHIIITGLLSLSSAIFATYGIWKLARNVVLSSRSVKHENFYAFASLPQTVDSPDMYADINVQRLSQAGYIHPI